MKKFLLWLGIGVLALIVALVLGRNLIARVSVEIAAKRVTGFPLEVGSVNVGLFNGLLDVQELKLMNPSDFEEKMFVDLPQFHLDYRLGSMLVGSPHINDMSVNLKQIVIVKNSKGESNVQRLKGVTSSGGGGDKTGGKTGGKGEGKSKSKYRVDTLRVHVGTVTIKDYSKGKPNERTIPLNVDATYKDITDSTDINRLVLLTVMNQAHLPDIGVSVDQLKKGLSGFEGTANEAVKGVNEASKGILDSIKKAIPQK